MPRPGRSPMDPRETELAFRSLLLGLFAGLLSGTVVTTALPRVVADLRGSQTAYTWVVAATMVASTVSLPLWGKLADRADRKTLIQLALGLFALGSVLAGLAGSVGALITGRAVQGLGAGGITALTQALLAALVPPRERGRHHARIAVVMTAGTVCGPLLGGVVADTPWLGWRWCFHLGAPLAAAAALCLHRFLTQPPTKPEVRRASPDLTGAVLLTGAVGVLLGGVTVLGAGGPFLARGTTAWVCAASLVCAVAVLVGLFLRAESRAADPVVPPYLFRDRTVVLCAVAGFAVGPALFASPALLGQYFQLARGQSPTVSGLLTLPMAGGLLLSVTITGRLISADGRWKHRLLLGGVLLVLSFSLMGTVRADTPLPLVCAYLFLGGAGVGATSQHLVVIAQNTAPPGELGAVTSLVTLARSIGGVFGVTALGAVLSARLDALATAAHQDRVPDLRTLPPAAVDVVQTVYGRALGDVFAVCVPFALITLLAVLLLRETPLGTTRKAGASPDTPR
ncbi:MFS transporter [Streptomyces sp. NPDC054863]